MRGSRFLTAGTAVLSVAVLGGGVLAGCSSSGGDDKGGGDAGKPKTVKVEMTADGCKATPDSVSAGPVTFEITNTNAAAVTEVELILDNRILGERENIAPGLAAVSFSHKLDGGTYELYCPGATNEKTKFTVTGKAAQATGTVADQLKQAAADYKTYVATQVGSLVDSTKALTTAVDNGDLAGAKAAYPKARPFYERIEPVAGAFCTDGSTDCSDKNSVSLDFAVDARPAAVGPTDKWTGFHVLEKQIFQADNLDGMKPVADDLLKNVQLLQKVVNEPKFGFAPADIVNGAGDLLDEVSTTKLTGEEEAYSHIDILDMQANIEGSEQAFAMVKPALKTIDPQLTQTITDAFAKVDSYIDTFRDGAQVGGFKLFTQVSDADKKNMAAAVIAVKDPLATAGGKIAAAS
ncbi:peptidase M75 family protein [Tsukamurella sp. 8F]|uniref:iron uptake system protein EfeO n=1 Tax=unclassified Tsukamurella TaxID=2633480 RepID=UPI0023BA222B|nr:MULTISPECIES: iron uptake system protein EfeO [unclassified Tsukamurella]MDF0530083.1 peptidase M75 family protein [Tsukamurella sp. 8J]MDF0586401.1 peptidase M75 family protein [Tsukamurella sp. 8F]